ncbi:LOW QUALITY PROTEIN: nucleoprotein TPR-like [Lethenteron reissneri]|uniref:LOW QUALITY PROTEIN: nucleoprotein TPR-like n=1 Tax=Lethenteron reissneri TaxID=7753 RepID=UPI002AB67AFA|nr:LOW QUALITY PROTEIN: nucleoprotein TPR-like [Lethenteron reissneri]
MAEANGGRGDAWDRGGAGTLGGDWGTRNVDFTLSRRRFSAPECAGGTRLWLPEQGAVAGCAGRVARRAAQREGRCASDYGRPQRRWGGCEASWSRAALTTGEPSLSWRPCARGSPPCESSNASTPLTHAAATLRVASRRPAFGRPATGGSPSLTRRMLGRPRGRRRLHHNGTRHRLRTWRKVRWSAARDRSAKHRRLLERISNLEGLLQLAEAAEAERACRERALQEQARVAQFKATRLEERLAEHAETERRLAERFQQVERLEEEKEEVEEEMNARTERLDRLLRDERALRAQLEVSLDELTTQVSDLESDRRMLQKRVSELEDAVTEHELSKRRAERRATQQAEVVRETVGREGRARDRATRLERQLAERATAEARLQQQLDEARQERHAAEKKLAEHKVDAAKSRQPALEFPEIAQEREHLHEQLSLAVEASMNPGGAGGSRLLTVLEGELAEQEQRLGELEQERDRLREELQAKERSERHIIERLRVTEEQCGVADERASALQERLVRGEALLEAKADTERAMTARLAQQEALLQDMEATHQRLIIRNEEVRRRQRSLGEELHRWRARGGAAEASLEQLNGEWQRETARALAAEGAVARLQEEVAMLTKKLETQRVEHDGAMHAAASALAEREAEWASTLAQTTCDASAREARLSATIEQLEMAGAELRHEASRLGQRAKGAERASVALRSQRDEARAELARLVEQLDRASATVREERESGATARKERDAAQAAHASLARTEAALRNRCSHLQQDVLEAGERERKTGKELQVARTQVESLTQELVALQEEQRFLHGKVSSLQCSEAKLLDRVQELEKSEARLKAQLNEAAGAQGRLEGPGGPRGPGETEEALEVVTLQTRLRSLLCTQRDLQATVSGLKTTELVLRERLRRSQELLLSKEAELRAQARYFEHYKCTQRAQLQALQGRQEEPGGSAAPSATELGLEPLAVGDDDHQGDTVETSESLAVLQQHTLGRFSCCLQLGDEALIQEREALRDEARLHEELEKERRARVEVQENLEQALESEVLLMRRLEEMKARIGELKLPGERASHALQAENSALQEDTASLQAENTTLQTDCITLQATVAKLQVDIANLHTDSTKLQADNVKLQADNTTLHMHNTTLQVDNTMLQENIVRLQTDSTILHAKNERLQASDEKLQADNVTSQQEITKLQADIVTLQQDNTKLQAVTSQQEITKLQADNVTSQQENTKLQADNVTLQQEITKLQADNVTSQQEITKLQADNVTLQQEITKLQADNVTSQQEITKLQADNVTSQQDNTKLQADNVTSQQEITKLQADNATSQQDNTKLQADNVTSQQEITKLQADNVTSQQEIPKLQADNVTSQQEITKLQADNVTLQQEITKIQADNVTSQQEITKLQADNVTSQQEITMLQADNVTSQQDNTKLQADNVTSQQEITKLQADNVTSQQEITKLQADNATSQQEITKLQADNVTSQQENTKLQADNVTSQQEITKLQADNVISQQEITKLQADNVTLQQEITKLQAHNVTSQQEITKLQADNVTSQQENTKLQADNVTSQQEITKLQADNVISQQEITKLQAENVTLQQEITKLQAHNVTSQQEITKLQADNVTSQQEITKLQADNVTSQQEITKLQADNVTSQQEITKLQADNVTSQQEITKLQADNVISQQEITKLQADNVTSQQEITKLQADNVTSQQEITKLQADNVTSQQEITKLQADNVTSQQEITKLQADNITSQQEITKIQADNVTSQQEITKLQADNVTSQQEITKLQADNVTSQQEITKLQADNVTSQQEITKLQADNATSQQEITKLQADNVTSQQEITKLQADNVTLQQEITKLQADNITSQQEITKIQADNVTSQQEITKLQADNVTSQQEITKLQADNVTSQQEITKLQADNVTSQQDNTKLQADNVTLEIERRQLQCISCKLVAARSELRRSTEDDSSEEEQKEQPTPATKLNNGGEDSCPARSCVDATAQHTTRPPCALTTASPKSRRLIQLCKSIADSMGEDEKPTRYQELKQSLLQLRSQLKSGEMVFWDELLERRWRNAMDPTLNKNLQTTLTLGTITKEPGEPGPTALLAWLEGVCEGHSETAGETHAARQQEGHACAERQEHSRGAQEMADSATLCGLSDSTSREGSEEREGSDEREDVEEVNAEDRNRSHGSQDNGVTSSSCCRPEDTLIHENQLLMERLSQLEGENLLFVTKNNIMKGKMERIAREREPGGDKNTNARAERRGAAGEGDAQEQLAGTRSRHHTQLGRGCSRSDAACMTDTEMGRQRSAITDGTSLTTDTADAPVSSEMSALLRSLQEQLQRSEAERGMLQGRLSALRDDEKEAREGREDVRIQRDVQELRASCGGRFRPAAVFASESPSREPGAWSTTAAMAQEVGKLERENTLLEQRIAALERDGSQRRADGGRLPASCGDGEREGPDIWVPRREAEALQGRAVATLPKWGGAGGTHPQGPAQYGEQPENEERDHRESSSTREGSTDINFLLQSYKSLKSQIALLQQKRIEAELAVAPLKARLANVVGKCGARGALLCRLVEELRALGVAGSPLVQEAEEALHDATMDDYLLEYLPRSGSKGDPPATSRCTDSHTDAAGSSEPVHGYGASWHCKRTHLLQQDNRLAGGLTLLLSSQSRAGSPDRDTGSYGAGPELASYIALCDYQPPADAPISDLPLLGLRAGEVVRVAILADGPRLRTAGLRHAEVRGRLGLVPARCLEPLGDVASPGLEQRLHLEQQQQLSSLCGAAQDPGAELSQCRARSPAQRRVPPWLTSSSDDDDYDDYEENEFYSEQFVDFDDGEESEDGAADGARPRSECHHVGSSMSNSSRASDHGGMDAVEATYS